MLGLGRCVTGVVCLAMSISGCALAPSSLSNPSFLAKEARPEPKETPDPFEAMNRATFEGNQKFNHAVVYPIGKAYREDLPKEVREGIEAFATNLSEPMVFANNLLQLRLDAAATTLGRFVYQFNSRFGWIG